MTAKPEESVDLGDGFNQETIKSAARIGKTSIKTNGRGFLQIALAQLRASQCVYPCQH